MSHFENRGRVPSHHVRQLLEAVAAGMRTFIVPNGLWMWRSSFHLTSLHLAYKVMEASG